MKPRTLLGTVALSLMAALPATGSAQRCLPAFGYGSYYSGYAAPFPTQYVRGGRALQIGGATVVFGSGGGYYGQALAAYSAISPYGYGYGYPTNYGYPGVTRLRRNYRGW